MGKLMHTTQIKHSSHHHLLQLSSNLQLQNTITCSTCSGCNHPISSSDYIYACRPCNFFLHTSCSKFPELITHPSHPKHTLSLHPTPIYPGGFFRCDACTQQGTRFSYHCQICDFDLHVLCASKPLSVNHSFHQHPIALTFESPYGDKLGFSCDVCRGVGSADQWLYRCVSCEFDVHLHCATAKPPPQTATTMPTTLRPQFGSHGMSMGQAIQAQNNWQTHNPAAPVGVQRPMQPQAPVGLRPPQPQGGPVGFQCPPQPQGGPVPVGFQSYQAPAPVSGQPYQMQPQPYQMQPQPQQMQPQPQPYQMQPQPQQMQPQPYQTQPQPQPVAANQNGNGLADVMVTGFVDGMMQQLGQDFVSSLTGGGGGGGNGGGGDVINVTYECNTTNDYETTSTTNDYECSSTTNDDW